MANTGNSNNKNRVSPDAFEDIRIVRVIEDEITDPRLDGTRGSGLYCVPLQLTRQPSAEWANHFVETWDFPLWSSRHRLGIASVQGDRIILDGTTIQEVKNYHRDTLVKVVKKVNEEVAKLEVQRRRKEEHRKQKLEEHRRDVEETAKRISFDE